MKIDRYFDCACFAEVLRITHWDDGEIYLSLLKPRSHGTADWKQRLRHIWRILRDGDPWEDEMVLTKEEAQALGRYLLNPPQVEVRGKN